MLTTVRYSKRVEGDITRIPLSIPISLKAIRRRSYNDTLIFPSWGKSKPASWRVDNLMGWIALVGVVRF